MGSGNMFSFLCLTCTDVTVNRLGPGPFHNMEGELRLKVTISSSQLHEFWMNTAYKGAGGMWIGSLPPGAGTIDSLKPCWIVDYEKEKPQDIILVSIGNVSSKPFVNFSMCNTFVCPAAILVPRDRRRQLQQPHAVDGGPQQGHHSV